MTRFIRVLVNGKFVRIRGVRSGDLTVADSRGITESRALLKQIQADFQERIKPAPFSPFTPFRTVGLVAR